MVASGTEGFSWIKPKSLRSVDLLFLNSRLAKCKTRVTFWGARLVQIPSEKIQGVPYILNDLVEKVSHWCHQKNLSSTQRRLGNEIVVKLRRYHAESTQQIAESCCITRFLAWIRGEHVIPSAHYEILESTRLPFSVKC